MLRPIGPPPMAFNHLTPNLMVPDVAETVAWYTDTLDADVLGRMPPESDDPEWAQLALDDAWLMLQERASLESDVPVLSGRDVGGSFTLYVDVDDAAGLHERLAEGGETVVQELRETDYGRREFAIEDPNGYVLNFGEKL